jgi:hypothetical protein
MKGCNFNYRMELDPAINLMRICRWIRTRYGKHPRPMSRFEGRIRSRAAFKTAGGSHTISRAFGDFQ